MAQGWEVRDVVTCPDCRQLWDTTAHPHFCPTCGQSWEDVEAAAAFVIARLGPR